MEQLYTKFINDGYNKKTMYDISVVMNNFIFNNYDNLKLLSALNSTTEDKQYLNKFADEMKVTLVFNNDSKNMMVDWDSTHLTDIMDNYK